MMWNIVPLIILWLVGIICILIMKKIQPDWYIAYAIYDLAMCVMITVFAIHYLCQK